MVPINITALRLISFSILSLMIAALFIGGSMPASGNLFTTPWDKAAHVVTFGAIALLLGISFPIRSLSMILIITICLGGADEVHQMFVINRQAGLDDLMADAIGALLALPVIAWGRKALFED